MKFDNYLDEVLKNNRKDLFKKLALGTFLVICIVSIALKMIDGLLLDMGVRDGETNFNFGESEHIDEGIPAEGSKYYESANNAVDHHPNTLWFLTQFTGLTTIVVTLFIAIRFFNIKDKVPKGLRGVMTQRTLAAVTIYEFAVAAIFGSAMFGDFESAFNPDLKGLEILITVLAHAIIPAFTIIYALIFLIRNEAASLLKGRFIFKAMIFPTVYMIFYMLLTIVWDDPYPATEMHDKLDGNNFGNGTEDVGKIFLAYFTIYGILGVMMTIHNVLLLKVSKVYDPANDHEAFDDRARRVAEIKKKAIRDRLREVKKSSAETRTDKERRIHNHFWKR